MNELSRKNKILIVAGPTASGKTKEAIRLAKLCASEVGDSTGAEIISVDSRQVYRRLNIGTEKITAEEMQSIPHHLIDIREPSEVYSAGDFVRDATQIIDRLHSEGKVPILAGGTHFYFDALLYGLPTIEPNIALRKELEKFSNEELLAQIRTADPARAAALDPNNRRRLIRALEIIDADGKVPVRISRAASSLPYEIEWHILNPSAEEIRPRIDARLHETLAKGLVEEVREIRAEVGDARLNELGLEYKIVGEFLRGERSEESLFPILSSKLWQYARRQKAWLRKLQTEFETIPIEEVP
jgi:tRNA dimethylallyltransferase